METPYRHLSQHQILTELDRLEHLRLHAIAYLESIIASEVTLIALIPEQRSGDE